MSAPDDYPWTDEDFVPRDEPDPVEIQRHYIRQRLLRGTTPQDLQDELTGHGFDPVYATELIHSVITTGKYGKLEVGIEVTVNGVSAGFFRNPVFAMKQRLARRQERREREAAGESNDPNPGLRFTSPECVRKDLARSRARDRRRILVVVGGFLLVGAVGIAYVLLH